MSKCKAKECRSSIFYALRFCVDGLGGLACESFDCFMDNGARY